MASLEHIEVFVAVVECGGFAAAAQRLGTTRSTASRAVARLEQHLGMPLLHRTTRVVRPTGAGQDYYDRVAPLLESLGAAERALQSTREQPRGPLRVSLPHAFGVEHLTPVLAQYRARFPEVQLELQFDDAKADLVQGGFDVAIRGGTKLEQNLVARRLWPFEIILVASPEHLAQHGHPQAPADLLAHPRLRYSLFRTPERWTLHRAGVQAVVPTDPGLTSNAPLSIRALTVAGAGIAVMPSWAVCHHLRDGRLVRVLPEWTLGSAWFWAGRTSRRHSPPRTLRFIDLLAEAFPRVPWGLEAEPRSQAAGAPPAPQG